jgi:hypothetical protein
LHGPFEVSFQGKSKVTLPIPEEWIGEKNPEHLAFTEKLKAFKKSNIVLTREISDSATWDIESIEGRQDRLAKLAVQAWPLRPQ